MVSGPAPGEPAPEPLDRSGRPVPSALASYRGFQSELERQAAEWVANPVTTDDWKPNGKKFGGESQTLGVTNGIRNDVAKPGKKLDGGNETVCYAAHEKIASDLAYHLGLPVPPVALWERKDAKDVEHRWCSISGWAFPGARKFAEVGNVPEKHRGQAPAALSAMIAFDVWIGVEDRNNGNLVIDADYRSPQPTACVDYAWSLSKRWSKGNYPRTVINSYLQHFGKLSLADQQAMADQICDFDRIKIEQILAGIPKSFLPAEKAEIILEGLVAGQGTLHQLLGLRK